MPLAFVYLSQADLSDLSSTNNLPQIWAKNADVPMDEMTVSFIKSAHQVGKRYAAMAILHLPKLWSASQVEALQLGLAQALAELLEVEVETILVITTPLQSGHVVEAGAIEVW